MKRPCAVTVTREASAGRQVRRFTAAPPEHGHLVHHRNDEPPRLPTPALEGAELLRPGPRVTRRGLCQYILSGPPCLAAFFFLGKGFFDLTYSRECNVKAVILNYENKGFFFSPN